MKRTQIFTLIMAIFWTMIAVAAILLVSRMDLEPAYNIIFAAVAFVAVVGNWLRYIRSR